MSKVLAILAAVLLVVPAGACDQLTIVPSAQCAAVQQVQTVSYAQIVQPTVAVVQLAQVQYVQAVQQRVVVQRAAVCNNVVAVRANVGCAAAVNVNVANNRARLFGGRQVVKTRTVVRGRG